MANFKKHLEIGAIIGTITAMGFNFEDNICLKD
jgi:hypothetical protein